MLNQLSPHSHTSIFQHEQQRLEQALQNKTHSVPLDGEGLSISDIVAVSRYHVRSHIDVTRHADLELSERAIISRLNAGEIIYGINTGFGGSADARTQKLSYLQSVLIRELHYGILPTNSNDVYSKPSGGAGTSFGFDLGEEDNLQARHLPKSWTRAAILIRVNSLIKGRSGVRQTVIDRLQDLLRHDVIPLVPLRGSISASGDLSPLSYIGGAIQGKQTIQVFSSEGKSFASDAFGRLGLQPVTLQAKEGLAIVNGTATSAAVAALTLHDAHSLALVSQLLTAMSVEALNGSKESFDPVFSETRPHPGQIEAARNILNFMEGSRLIKDPSVEHVGLRQDRYSIRTAAQWIGPLLEDLVLAHSQLTIECNSVTDNPILSEGKALHGGNFQAQAVTSAMEKTRRGLQVIGRMLFTQCTEMINPVTSNGLPPNLVAENPSSSYIFKGTDLAIAAFQAELGFLSTPVNHVQTAEMGNQALNSLALISARYTATAVDVLSQMTAYHLIAVCQALDLRAMHMQFLDAYRPIFHRTLKETTYLEQMTASSLLTDPSDNKPHSYLEENMWSALLQAFKATVNMDVEQRFDSIVRSLRNTFLDDNRVIDSLNAMQQIGQFTKEVSESMRDAWCSNRDAYLVHGRADSLLGQGSKSLYTFVRDELHVPMLCTAQIKTPQAQENHPELVNATANNPVTVGSYHAILYEAIRDGRLAHVLFNIL